MNGRDLKKFLGRLEVPAASATAKERARYRASAAFLNAGDTASSESADAGSRGGRGRWVFAACASLACLLAVLHFFRGGTSAGDKPALASARTTLEQVEMLFPGQVNAVIQRGGDLDLELSDAPAGGDSQPVVVEFLRGDDAVRVISYSGRRVRVMLGGSIASFEPLVTSEGEIILSGEDFLWTPERSWAPSGYRVEARFLVPAS